MISMPKPGSIVSILSQSSRVRRLTSRDRQRGADADGLRCGCRRGGKADRGAGRQDPSSSSAAQSSADQLADVAGDGLRRRRSARRRRGATSIRSGGRIGSIGSATRPRAWSSRRPSSGPKRRASGARGWASKIADALEAEDAQVRRHRPAAAARAIGRCASTDAPCAGRRDEGRVGRHSAPARGRRPSCRRSPRARRCRTARAG